MWTLCRELVVQLKEGLSTEMTLHRDERNGEEVKLRSRQSMCEALRQEGGGHIQETDLRPVCAELGETGEKL